MQTIGGFRMGLLNLASFLLRRAKACSICGIAMIVLVGGCSSSGLEAPQVTTNSNDEVPLDPQVRDTLASACFDCHSNDKPAVWTARLAPSYLFGVDKARQG